MDALPFCDDMKCSVKDEENVHRQHFIHHHGEGESSLKDNCDMSCKKDTECGLTKESPASVTVVSNLEGEFLLVNNDAELVAALPPRCELQSLGCEPRNLGCEPLNSVNDPNVPSNHDNEVLTNTGGDETDISFLKRVKYRTKRKKKTKNNVPTEPSQNNVDGVLVSCSESNDQSCVVKLTKNNMKKLGRKAKLLLLLEQNAIDQHNIDKTLTNESKNCLPNNEKCTSRNVNLNSCKDILELQTLLLNYHISNEDHKSDPIASSVPHNVATVSSIPQDLRRAAPSNLRGKKCIAAAKTKKIREMVFQNYLGEEEALQRLRNKELVEGIVRINSKHYQTAYVSNPSSSLPDYVIEGVPNRNRALDGDVVLLSLADMTKVSNVDHKPQQTAKVVFIKQKVHSRTAVGHLKLMDDNNRKMAYFIPRDHRIPRMYIPFTCWPNLFYEEHVKYAQVLFVAKIEKWIDVKFAVGSIVSTLGHCGELKVEAAAILAENCLDVTPFPSSVHQFYPRSDYEIPAEELQYRKDCRKMCVFTIDPLTARDLDDAVSCRLLENGNFEVGVHIADVSFFLKEGTILDEIVASKATTVYMVDKAYHMLPEDLCLLCSLSPGYDKVTFSVFWEFTKTGEIKNKYICRTIINSCVQLAYEHVQKMIEEPEREFSREELPKIYGDWSPKDINEAVQSLFQLSLIFKKQRFDSGALKIDQPKLYFQLDLTSGMPLSYAIYENKESNQLIEEFMLLANMTVAKKIYEDFPRLAFLRRHPPPNVYMLNELAKNLEPLGILLDVSTAGRLQSSLLHFLRSDVEDDGVCLVLNALSVKPMARALYFCADGFDDDDFWHYALHVPLYTHFTSPIRRFADIMVHRLLSASLGYSEKPDWNVNNVHMIAANCNKQKYNAKRAGEMSSEMYIHMYISQNAPMVVKAVVVDVKMSSIDVIILDNGLTRRIHLGTLKAHVVFIRSEKSDKLNKFVVTWHAADDLPESTQIIELFSSVNIRLDKTKDPFKVTSQLERPNSSGNCVK